MNLKNNVDPFSDAYMAEEVRKYGVKEYEKGRVKIFSRPIVGRCDDYLNVEFRTDSEPMPILLIDDNLWMSLSFMEIQSHYLPILRSNGKVATGGLGLGYYTMRVAQKDEVESVDVYEKERAIIDFFIDKFGQRDWFKKIKIIEGDVRKLMKKCEYDFVYMDIYQTLLEDSVITDAAKFPWSNYIKEYHFWGQELVLLNDKNMGFDVYLMNDEIQFFSQWSKTPGSRLKCGKDLSEEFVVDCLNAMGREF